MLWVSAVCLKASVKWGDAKSDLALGALPSEVSMNSSCCSQRPRNCTKHYLSLTLSGFPIRRALISVRMAKLSPVDFESPRPSAIARESSHGRRFPVIWRPDLLRPGFNCLMTYGAVSILLISVLGCKLTDVHMANAGDLVLTFVLSAAILLPLSLYLYDKRKFYLFDLITITYWAFYFAYMLFFPVEVAARLGSHIALKDDQLLQIDRALHMSVPSVQAWASQNWLGRIASPTYPWLFTFMRTAVLLPPLAGRSDGAKKFLTANLIVFAIGIPLFAIFPAVGPWYGYHTVVRPDQMLAQDTLLFIRRTGPIQFRIPSGIICFPSFHVVWAILCTYALWSFRYLRIPASTLSALIILSTLTTGVHYAFDLVGGALIAVSAIYASQQLTRASNLPLAAVKNPWHAAMGRALGAP